MRKIDDREKKFFLFIVATKGRSQKKKLMEFSIKLAGWVRTLNGKFHYYYFFFKPNADQLECRLLVPIQQNKALLSYNGLTLIYVPH